LSKQVIQRGSYQTFDIWICDFEGETFMDNVKTQIITMGIGAWNGMEKKVFRDKEVLKMSFCGLEWIIHLDIEVILDSGRHKNRMERMG
jgi:hypothetical protein